MKNLLQTWETYKIANPEAYGKKNIYSLEHHLLVPYNEIEDENDRKRISEKHISFEHFAHYLEKFYKFDETEPVKF